MTSIRTLCFVLLLTGQAVAGQIRVSDTDSRQYRALRLDSGLEVLLVRDERTAKAAAAVAVGVGSLDNPDSQLGLAHYLEHMLFLGSASYPGAEDYQAFINRNGGRTNASTGYTSTTYMMEVDPPAFAEALRRMADTLARPLLNPVYADKERNAVNAEMESLKYSDGRRMAMLALSTLNPAHPASRFSGGNLATLSDKPDSVLQEELIRFHRQHYRGNLMKAALYGPQSLDELETLARKELAAIPGNGAEIQPPAAPPVTDREQGVIFGVRPVGEVRSLTVEFVLPGFQNDRTSKPVQTLSAVLGTETEHSLVDVLRRKGLALGLSAGGDTETLRNGVSLSLTVRLTEKGDRNRDEVLGVIFAYLEMLRTRGIGPEYFDQTRDMMNMEFRFAPMSSGFDYVLGAAGLMLRYPVEDVNYGPYRMDAFAREAVADILSRMTPDRARVFQVGTDQPADKKAFFYETPYSVRPIGQDDLARWKEASRAEEFRLPALNPFVPDDFSLVANDPGKPRKLVDKPGLRVWQAASRFRREPKAILLTRLQSAHFSSTPVQEAMQGILLELWNQNQAGLHYQAQEAGLDLSVSGDGGLLVRIGGFSQHQADLLPRVLAFLDQKIGPEAFEQARAEYLRGLANMAKRGVFGQAMQTMGNLMRVPSWSRKSLENAAKTITLEDWTAWLHAARGDMDCTVFGFGNISAGTLTDLERVLAPYATAAGPAESRRILPVPGVTADYRESIALEDSVLVELFLDPEPGENARARAMLLEELLSTRFYSQLRTEEQLGYIVTTFPVMFAHCAGVGFGAQSPVAGTAELVDRFGAFFFHALEQMRGVTAEEFETVRLGALASITRTPDTLEEEFGWLEADLRLGNAAFDGRTRLTEALRRTTLPEVVRLYETLILGPRGTRVLIQAQGQRFQGAGFAKKPGAVEVTEPEGFHTLMGAQRYRGL